MLIANGFDNVIASGLPNYRPFSSYIATGVDSANRLVENFLKQSRESRLEALLHAPNMTVSFYKISTFPNARNMLRVPAK